MYNLIDGRNFSGAKNLQVLNLISKTFKPLIRNGFELNNFNRLPVIREEEGNPNEDEQEQQQNILRRVLQKNCKSKKGTAIQNSNRGTDLDSGPVNETKSLSKLPPLASINCFLDNNIRQQVWETDLGKCLRRGKISEEHLNLSKITIPPTSAKKCNEKFSSYEPSGFLPKTKSIYKVNSKNDAGNKGDCKQLRTHKKKSKTFIIKDTDVKSKSSQEKTQAKKLLEDSFSASSFDKNQKLLAESIQSITGDFPREPNYKHSNDILSSAKDLCSLVNRHEFEKKICILCEKVFHNSQKFVQHLVAHEAVDRFCCKKCKTHFLSLKKHQQHCKDFQFFASNDIKNQIFDNEKKWLPKFECKRCKTVFDTKQNYQAHKRKHIKKDFIEYM